MSDDVTAYQKALAELLAALPHCERLKQNGSLCFATATRESFTGHGFHAEYLCDEHGNGEDGLFWDDAVRKAQALMALPEEPAPPTCTPREVLKSLGGAASFVRVTNDGTGERVAEVDMGPAGKATIRIEADDTTETLVAKVRAAFAAKEEQEQHDAETRCEVCSRVINVGDDVLFCSEDDTVQHARCSGLTNARGTPWMG